MSIRILSAVWDDGPSGRTEMLVLMALADHADANGACFPSQKTIGKKARASERTVREALKALAEEGWIRITTRRTSDGKNTSHLYHINLGKIGLRDRKPPAIPAQPPAEIAASTGKNCRTLPPAEIAAKPSNIRKRRDSARPMDVSKLTELQKSLIRAEQSVLVGDDIVRPGSSEMVLLREALFK